LTPSDDTCAPKSVSCLSREFFDCTRECLALVADTSISGIRVARDLDRLLVERGRPGTIVSDNGTELTSNVILQWADDHKVAWHYIAPGKPPFAESSAAWATGTLFRSLPHVRAVLEAASPGSRWSTHWLCSRLLREHLARKHAILSCNQTQPGRAHLVCRNFPRLTDFQVFLFAAATAIVGRGGSRIASAKANFADRNITENRFA
jgi:transposase InsO family protein